ncbi:MAG: Fur family transcriptional regulator [Opitutales bacterium]
MAVAEEKSPLLKKATQILRDNGHRITRSRIQILRAFVRQEGPAKIEEIHSRMGTETCDLATVYRFVAALEELELVRRCFLRDGTSLYEFGLRERHQHHIICTQCQKVEAFDACFADVLEPLVRERGYSRISHVLEFFGICPRCSEK